MSCGTLDTANYTVYSTWGVVPGTTASSTSISIPGFASGYVFLSIITYDSWGDPLVKSFQLLFGSATMAVLVLDPAGLPASGVPVFCNATTYVGIGATGITDSAGKVTFSNVPSTTIGFLAKTSTNQVSVGGVAGGSITSITLNLLPLSSPVPGASGWNVDNGTAGWTGGTVQNVDPNFKRELASQFKRDIAPTYPRIVDSTFDIDTYLYKRDTSLVVYTNNSPNLQMAFKTFAVDPGTSTVYARYKFQTDEVPGGYFGTKYNDYYSVIIRSDHGDIASVSHSMNELGLGAFNAAGSTQWYTLTMPVSHGTLFVEFNVAVSNVADAALQSQVIVSSVGECDKCADCTKCPNNPQCQSTCKTPPPNSCNFYSTCLESVLTCGSSGFPLGSGLKTCNRFQNTLNKFSADGKTWYAAAEQCLQQSLVPYLTCEATCEAVQSNGFGNVQYCYQSSGVGFCNLNGMDYVHILSILDTPPYRSALKQTAGTQGCPDSIASAITNDLQQKLHDAGLGINVEQNVADAKSLATAYKFFNSVKNDGPVQSVDDAVKYIQQVHDTAQAYIKYFAGHGITIPFNANQLSMQWLRHVKYDGWLSWKALLLEYIGTSWIDFATQTILPLHSTYPDPASPPEAVGFDHWGATMEAVLVYGTGSRADIGGWLGDLFQLYHDWQRSGMAGSAFCQQYFAKPGSLTGFPLEDLRQDADAFNIGMLLRASPSMTLPAAFSAVVKGGGYATRFKTFFNGRFGGSQTTATNLCMTDMTVGILGNPDVWLARRGVTQWPSKPWGGPVPYPEDIPPAQLQDFCNGWAAAMAGFAASG